MKKRTLFALPCASTSIVLEPTLVGKEGNLLLSATCDDDGRERLVSVLFVGVRAFRHRAESLCTVWHVEGAYDTLCEVEDSEWVKELRRDAVPEWRDHFVMRHFMIYLDSYASLEVIAATATLNYDGAENPGGT